MLFKSINENKCLLIQFFLPFITFTAKTLLLICDVAWFGTICIIWKTWKTLLLVPATSLIRTLLHECFSRFWNNTNATKARKSCDIQVVLLQLTSIAAELFYKSNCQPERYKLAPISSPSHFSFFFLFACYLAVPRPTLGGCRGGSLTNPMLLLRLKLNWLEGHRELHVEVWSQSPTEQLVGFEQGSFQFWI